MEEKNPAPEPCRASLLAVASTDPPSFVFSIVLAVLVLTVLGIFIHSRITGLQPVEPWSLVAAVMIPVVAAMGAFIRYRWRSINRVLASGRRTKARKTHFAVSPMWVIVHFDYEADGRQGEEKIWLANSGRSRSLEGMEEVDLVFDPQHPGWFVVASLYGGRGEAAS